MDNLVFQALDKVNNGIVIIDRDWKIIVWNKWLENFTGLESKEATGKNLKEVSPQFSKKFYENILQQVFFHGQSRFCSSSFHKAFFLPKEVIDEELIKQNVLIEPIYQDDRTYALIQLTDMTHTHERVYKLKNLIKELEVEVKEVKTNAKLNKHLALHDSLTGLPNRLYFNDRLAWAIQYAKRNKEKLAIMFIDLDGFKSINDTFGHETGDMVLIEVATRLKSCIRSVDTLARIGGDEFTVVLNQLKDEKNASIVARKFIEKLREPVVVNNCTINLSISIGISTYPNDGEEPLCLINKADMAMYEIKLNGKNGYKFPQ